MRILNLIKKHYQQLTFVFVAFFTMAVISYYYVNDIAGKHLREQGNEAVEKAEARLKTILGETEVALNDAAYTIYDMISRGETQDDIVKYLEDWNLWLAKNLVYYDCFNGVYGVVRGEFMSGVGWVPPEDYTPETSVWYEAAASSWDAIIFTDPYIDVKTGAKVITVAKRIFDENGYFSGVIAIDLNEEVIAQEIELLQVSGSGYGVILNKSFNIIVHKDDELIGKRITEINDTAKSGSTKRVTDNITALKTVSGERFVDYDKTRSVGFFKKIFNGWTIGVIVPISSFYADVYDMSFVTAIMSFMLILIVGYFIILLSFEKLRSDEENKSKTSFLAKMSHEIRTPLNAVLGMSELILREDIPHNIYEHALSIKQASSNLLSIINDILDYSKIESGKLEIVAVKYYFSSLMNDVISIIRMRITDKPIKLVVNIDSNIPNSLFGDEVRIRQVLINLLSNAVKYTREGFISVNVIGDKKGDGLYDFIIEIADSGIGIKEEDMLKLFGDFVQINMAANKGIEGTGLGLAIARNICRAMDGDITVKSVYGEGSTFTARIVQSYEEYEKFAKVKDADAKQVLLYETRLVYAQSVAKTLKNLGVKCTVVHNQANFHEEMKKFTYPFIFISSFLFGSVKNILEKLGVESKIVLLSEYGEVITAKCNRIIEMPAHCIPIANVLNDIIEDSHFRDNSDTGIRFVAPTANVLIVDDIATNLKVAEGLMAPYNMKIETCKSGAEAIEKVKKNRYDVIFMDHMMPGMDGIEATDKIRKIEDDTNYYQELPIIALTAVAVSGVKEMFIQNGLNDFLAKPIEVAKLNAILEKWIPKSKQEKYLLSRDSEEGVSIEIEGIDTKVGLSMTGGTYDSYIRVLDIFYKDCIEKIDEISQALTNNEIYLYTTYVHALKSASANVGALKVSEFAKSLELAGKNEDVAYIAENNEEFLQSLRILLKNINLVLRKTNEEKTSDTASDDIVKLKDDLMKLKSALDEMDIGTVDIIVNDLQSSKWSSNIRDSIENISHSILMFEYTEAIEMIDEMLR